MPRFKSLSSGDFSLFAPPGYPDAFPVAAGGEVEIPGDVAAETEDAYIVGEGGNARAWSKVLWALVTPAAKAGKEN